MYQKLILDNMFELKESKSCKYLEGIFFRSYRGLIDHYVSKLYNPFIIQIFNQDELDSSELDLRIINLPDFNV